MSLRAKRIRDMALGEAAVELTPSEPKDVILLSEEQAIHSQDLQDENGIEILLLQDENEIELLQPSIDEEPDFNEDPNFNPHRDNEDPDVNPSRKDDEDPDFNPRREDDEDPDLNPYREDDEDPDFNPRRDDEDPDFNPQKKDGGISSSDTNGDNNGEQINTKKKTRKRIRNENTWKRNLKKKKINSGQEYTSRLGKVHRAKAVKPPCDEHCLYKCAVNVSKEKRLLIFQQFYNLADKTRQRDFILNCMKTITPKATTQNPQENEPKRRKKNHGYYFEIDETDIRVCKNFFMATLDISNNTISTAVKKAPDGFLEKELRGTGQSSNKTSDNLTRDVEDHINSFPRVKSHYCRARTEKEYIDGTLNISLMYKLYKEKCDQDQKPYVQESLYRKIFNNKFNISFFQPKKDQCSFCVIYEKHSSETEKELKKNEYDTHKENVRNSRLEKEGDKKHFMLEKDVVLATFDLQAVMPLPNGNISTFFYKSKLNAYNFTVYNVESREGICYLWNESIAKRGAIEIATGVYTFLKDYCQGKKEVIFYSDNCNAQNKNKFMFCMYLYALKTLNIQTITHKYLIVGHTENEGDSVHACIEKEKKRILKQGPIFVPSELAMIIRCAKKNAPLYIVNEMETGDFIDWKNVCTQTGKNFNVNTDGEKCLWQNVKMIQVTINDPDLIKYKTSYSETHYSKFINVKYRMRGRRRTCESIELKPAYTEPPRIPANKLKDLISLCESKTIPQRYHQFFFNLKGQENVDIREDTDDEGDL